MKFVLGLAMGVVGVSALTGCSARVGEDEEVSSAQSQALFSSTVLARALRNDYDKDGKEDVMFMTDDFGTYETLGRAPGGFGLTGATLIRSDLNNGNVFFHAGDFNKDSITDLLATTSAGTVEWTGKVGGGFNTVNWPDGSAFQRVDNTPASFDMILGDFNGDGATDFIATTSAGSYLYTGKSTGGFNKNAWSSTATAFKRGNVTLTAGNFDADGTGTSAATTDFIATTTSGSSLYSATVSNTGVISFTVKWSAASLTQATVRFAVGNFNGVGADDFIVQKLSGGASLYTAVTPQPSAGPSFNANAWTQATLGITGSPLTVGDYNGDGCSDFLYQGSNFQGQNQGLYVVVYKQGTPQVPGTFRDAQLVDARFHDFYINNVKRGDFNGDGYDDFLVQMKPDVLGSDGTHEFVGTSNAGIPTTPPAAPRASGGFTPDVWTDQGLIWNTAF